MVTQLRSTLFASAAAVFLCSLGVEPLSAQQSGGRDTSVSRYTPSYQGAGSSYQGAGSSYQGAGSRYIPSYARQFDRLLPSYTRGSYLRYVPSYRSKYEASPYLYRDPSLRLPGYRFDPGRGPYDRAVDGVYGRGRSIGIGTRGFSLFLRR